MYNNYQPPGQYGRPPNYGSSGGSGGYPGQSGSSAPGLGAPGLGPPPGVAAAPGIQSPTGQQQQGGFPSNFQPPANMPNINFNARVIRLGTSGPAKPESPTPGNATKRDGPMDGPPNRRGMGLGYDGGNRDQQRHQNRDAPAPIQPPSREEIARTIFIGNITDGCGGDEGIQKLIGVAGGLRRWIRASDADSKPCSFGFAEYEDADSLVTAIEVLRDVKVPKKRPTANGNTDDTTEPEKTTLMVVVDENSENYIEEWRARGSLMAPQEAQLRLDSAREQLQGILTSLENAASAEQSNHITAGSTDQDGDTNMQDGETTKVDAVTGEVVTIPLTTDDDLSDIPAEMRETVAKEIAAFRDRSNRRDLERLRREEEMEQAEKARANNAARVNRLASPATESNTGTNGIPSGPRDRGIQGAPLGPKGFQGAQIPRDYQRGVSFVNGAAVNGDTIALTREEEESDASDEEIERRRKEKRNADLEKQYLDQERRWLNRERNRLAALEREKQRDKEEESNNAREKQAAADRLKAWNDDAEAERKAEEYYRDRSLWLRNRTAFRAREAELDDRDRAAEEQEKAKERDRRNKEMGMADQFLAQQAEELESRAQAQPQRFKMSLGAAAQKAQQPARRTVAEVEGLLEDEEDAGAAGGKRTLVPLSADVTSQGAGLSEEERAEAVRKLAKEIPSDKEGLWSWPIKWEFVDDAVITDQLRPFVERKIVDYLGVQEQMLVDVVEECIRKKGSPQELVGDLEGALDEEAEVMVKKLWRMLIFFSESEKRGLST